MTKVDLLVCNYNTKDKLKRLLDTLHADHEDDVWNLYVADNGSQDGSHEWLKSVRDDYDIEAIFKNPNVGYSAAINAMGACSGSEILCAVNADTWFSTHHVQQSYMSFVGNPSQGVMGPKQMDEQGRIRHGGIFWDGGKNNPIHRGWAEFDLEDGLYKDTTPCWTVSGSLYYVRRDYWEKLTNHPTQRKIQGRELGPMLDTFMYFEETYVSVAAPYFDYEVIYNGNIETAGHTWHASNNPGDNSHHFHSSKNKYVEACNAMGFHHEVKE
jgi:GT2 family glycosyltransferase